MKPTLTVTIAWLILSSSAFGQTADNLVLQGRSFLAARDITNANSRFAAAVKLTPGHQTANVLHAATRLLNLPYTQPWQNMMDRLGVALTNRSIYSWTADVPRDSEGVPVPPNDLGVPDLIAFARTNLLPEVKAAQANLSQVTDTNFILNLSSNETTVGAATLDYADLQVCRAILYGAEFVILFGSSYDSSAQLNAIYSMHAAGSLSVQEILASYPRLLTVTDINGLQDARIALTNGINSYRQASDLIRKRPSTAVRLFNYDPEADADEKAFSQTLSEIEASLRGPVALTYATNGSREVTLNLTSVFSGALAPRSVLPQFTRDAAMLGTLPDPTLNGVVFGLTESDWYQQLGGLQVIPHFKPAKLGPDGTIEILLAGVNGRSYEVEASLDLRSWSYVDSRVCSNGVVRFKDTITSNRGFFRARQE